MKKLASEIITVFSLFEKSATVITAASLETLLRRCFAQAFVLEDVVKSLSTTSSSPLPISPLHFKKPLVPVSDWPLILKLLSQLEQEFQTGLDVLEEANDDEGGIFMDEVSEHDDSDTEDATEVAGAATVAVAAVQSIFHKWLLNPTVSRSDKSAQLQIWIQKLFDAPFPLRGDEVTFIGSTFMNYDQKSVYKSVCLVVGDCHPQAGIEIVSCINEQDMLLKWAQLIQTEDPDILTGYNIFGFDYEFMLNRAVETGCVHSFLALSRKRNHLAAKRVEKKGHKPKWTLEQKKIVLASGPFDMKYFNIPGRLQIDLYCYLRRDYSLSSYKLDDVSAEFICDKIDKFIPTATTTEIMSKNLKGLNVGDFVHLEKVEYTTDYLCGGRKFQVLQVCPQERKFVIDGTIPDLDEIIRTPHATFK